MELLLFGASLSLGVTLWNGALFLLPTHLPPSPLFPLTQLSASKIILNILNIVTITIPPTLPLSLTIGLSAAFTRLQAYKIFCIK